MVKVDIFLALNKFLKKKFKIKKKKNEKNYFVINV